MRSVTVSEWYRPEGAKYTDPYQKREVGKGKFHQFGVDYEQLEGGVGNFSTAIVEMPGGEIVNVAVDMIVFLDQ